MITVYTAIFDRYETLLHVDAMDSENVEYLAFTDTPQPEAGWASLTPSLTEADGRRENRKYKTLAHRWFPAAEWTIYLDGNLQLLVSPQELIEVCLSADENASLYLFPHNKRDCLYAEANACLQQKKGNPTAIERQVARYKTEGYPAGKGLYWGGVLIRRKGCEEFNRRWWAEIRTGSCRDQISLPYVLWKSGVQHAILNYPIPFYGGRNPFVKRKPHSRR